MIVSTISSIDKKISKSGFLILYFSVIVLWLLAFSFQGMNMTDEGWVLSGYQQIFNDPDSVEYLFLYYLSIFVGGVWNFFFGSLGIFSFRLLGIVLTCIMAGVAYKLLIKFIGRWQIFLGVILILLVFVPPIRYYHNLLSCLLSLICAYFLYLGLTRCKSKYFFLAGLVYGINIFTRLPNVAMILYWICLIPFVYYKSARRIWRLIVASLCGIIVGIGCILLLMLVLGHLEIFVSAINDIVIAGNDPESTHNLHSMLLTYVGNYLNLAKLSLFLFFFPGLCAIIYRRRSNQPDRLLNILLLVLLVFSGIWVYIWGFSLECLAALLTVTLVASIIYFRNDSYLVYICLLGLISYHAQCIGGDQGFANMNVWCMWLSVPLSVGMMDKLVNRIFSNSNVKEMLTALFVVFVLVYCFRGLKAIMLHDTFYEHSPRWTMLYKPDAKLATTLISKDNKLKLDSALVEVRKYVKAGDYLLCLERLPMMNYLTETKPYLGNPWVWTYTPKSLAISIKKAEKRNKGLPVIIEEKGAYMQYDPQWNNPNGNNTYIHNNARIAQYISFINRHNYQKVWENGNFVILLPMNKK